MMITKIPLPFKGYINSGDSMVLIAGLALSPLYGFLAAAAVSLPLNYIRDIASLIVGILLIKFFNKNKII